MNYSNHMDLTEEVKLVEKELVDLIIAHLKSNSIAVEAARQQARDFLALLPVSDQRDLLNKLKGLGEKYVEAKTVYAEELGKVNEVERQRTLEEMRSHISAGNIDAAIAAAKAMYPPKDPSASSGQENAVQSTEVTAPPVSTVAPAPETPSIAAVTPEVATPTPVVSAPEVPSAPTPPVMSPPIEEKGGQV